MKLSPDQWRIVSALVDQALELPLSQRSTWLASHPAVPGLPPELSQALRRMMDGEAEAQTSEFLFSLSGLCGDRPSERASGLQAGDAVGAYRLLRELGRGGMGTVWLAERTDGLLKRPVALKLPHLSGESGALRERFARERDILAALNHPNIARLYDAGLTSEGQPFLALEYVEGRALLQECDARSLALRQRLELFGQVLEAVKYAHAHLVVHRDLKPSNILVTPDGQIKLLDFGIAKLVAQGEASETELTQLGGRAMTPDYASPEQVLGEPITTASDVYSLGVLLYELLCGQRPYRLKRISRGALEEAIVAAEPAAPSTLTRQRELRGDLDTIVLKALKKKPADRYDSAAALAEDLRRYRARLPVLAQPDSWWYRCRRFMARNWVPVSAIAAVFVALVAGTGVSLWQAATALQAQARADQVKRFISSIFSDAGPAQAQGKNATATAAELLVRASQRVPREFAASPRVAAELDRIISDGLLDLGEAGKASEQLQQALQRDSAALGEHDLLVSRVRIGLALVYRAQGKWTEQQPLLLQAVQDLRPLGRAGAGDLIEALSALATLQFQLGGSNNQQNLALAREAVAVADRWLKADEPQRLWALSTLVNMLRLHARPGEALGVAQRAVDLARQQFGARRPQEQLAYAELDLAILLCVNDRPGEAVPLARQVLTDLSALKSADTDAVGYAADVLAGALNLSGHPDEAEENSRRAIRVVTRLRPQVDADLAAMNWRLGQIQLEARHPDLALEQMQTADRMIAAAGANRGSWELSKRQLDRAEALIYLGRTDEAQVPLAAVSGRVGEDPTHLWLRLAQLQSLRLRLIGQAQLAVDTASEALRRMQKEQPGPRSAAALQVTLAQALLDAGQASAARPLLAEALNRYQTAQVALSARVADALVGLGRADLALGDAPSALASLQRASDFWHRFNPDSVWAAEAGYWYGHALQAAGQTDAGRALTTPAAARLMRSPFALHRQLAAREPTAPG